MNEVLGALGLAWPRLLIYPGGLAALCGAWLLARCWGRAGRRVAPDAEAGSLVDLLPPLLALTLLPLPPARPFPYGLDLPTALVLIEWPYWRRLARTGALAPAMLQALVQPYGLLLLAFGALATATGSVELAALTRWPDAPAEQTLLALGTLLWLALLPQLLGTEVGAPWPLQFRALALLSLPALALIGALAAMLEPWLSATALAWLLTPLALTVNVVLVRSLRGLPQRWLQRLWWALGGAVAGLLALVSVGAPG